MDEAKIFLQNSVEEHIYQICEIACKIASHCNRQTLQVRDVKLALNIIGVDIKAIKKHKATLKLTRIRLVEKVRCRRVARDIDEPLIKAAKKYIHTILETLYIVDPDIKYVTKTKLKAAQQTSRVDAEPIDKFWRSLEKGDDIGSDDDEPLLVLKDVSKKTKDILEAVKKKMKQHKKTKKKVKIILDDDETDTDTEWVHGLSKNKKATLKKLATKKKSKIRPKK